MFQPLGKFPPLITFRLSSPALQTGATRASLRHFVHCPALFRPPFSLIRTLSRFSVVILLLTSTSSPLPSRFQTQLQHQNVGKHLQVECKEMLMNAHRSNRGKVHYLSSPSPMTSGLHPSAAPSGPTPNLPLPTDLGLPLTFEVLKLWVVIRLMEARRTRGTASSSTSGQPSIRAKL